MIVTAMTTYSVFEVQVNNSNYYVLLFLCTYSALNPFQLSGNTGTLRLPAPAGNQAWIIESNVDGRIGTVSASERSFSFDISRLRAGDHVLTVSTERGAQLARVNIRGLCNSIS